MEDGPMAAIAVDASDEAAGLECFIVVDGNVVGGTILMPGRNVLGVPRSASGSYAAVGPDFSAPKVSGYGEDPDPGLH